MRRPEEAGKTVITFTSNPTKSYLRCMSKTARLLALRVRILPGASISVSCVACQVQVSATGPSLVQRNPAGCGVSVYGLETFPMKSPRPANGCCAEKKKIRAFTRKLIIGWA
jgi:hypothetical protein